MTGREAVDYFHRCGREGRAPGLGRVRDLLGRLGDPQRGGRYVHVAGTNGKGSVCAMLDAILRAAGYRVGLNTSPYLESFAERIRVDGENIPEKDLASLAERLRPAAEAGRPTEFELITAAALTYFRERACEISVLEVGLGGALDASNVIDTPEAAVLTAMGLDHMAVLGPTMAEIAAAKAGIIKPGGTVVSMGGCPEADEVFRRACRDRGAALREADLSRLGAVSLGLDGAVFDFAPYRALRVNLAGAYQVRNAALAVTAAEALRDRGWRIGEDALRRGLASVRWPGRFELLRRGPPLVLDGAHNGHGMAAAAESLRALFPGKRLVCVLGVLADKDAGAMLDALAPLTDRAYTVRPGSPRAMEAEELARLLRDRGVEAAPCASAAEALGRAERAAGRGGAVFAGGSLYLAADIRRAAGR